MVNKELCKKCWIDMDEIVDEEAKEGRVACPILWARSKEGVSSDKTTAPPDECPYLFEQSVFIGMKNKK
jgi:hypothetical protein